MVEEKIEEEINDEKEEKKDEIEEKMVEENNNFISCIYYFYLDSSNNYQCTMTQECPSNKEKLMINKKECIDKCMNGDTYIYKYNNKC